MSIIYNNKCTNVTKKPICWCRPTTRPVFITNTQHSEYDNKIKFVLRKQCWQKNKEFFKVHWRVSACVHVRDGRCRSGRSLQQEQGNAGWCRNFAAALLSSVDVFVMFMRQFNNNSSVQPSVPQPQRLSTFLCPEEHTALTPETPSTSSPWQRCTFCSPGAEQIV